MEEVRHPPITITPLGHTAGCPAAPEEFLIYDLFNLYKYKQSFKSQAYYDHLEQAEQ